MAQSKKKFYKTSINLEILSDEPIVEQDIESIANGIRFGDFAGKMGLKGSTVITAKEAAKGLIEQGYTPDFFNLNEKGEEIEWLVP